MESPRRKPSAKPSKPPAKPYVFRYFTARQRRASDRRAAKRATPEQMAARIPTIGLLARMFSLVQGLARTAHGVFLQAQAARQAGAPPPKQNPHLPLIRVNRALARIYWLTDRLDDPKRLPDPSPPQPRPTRVQRAAPRPLNPQPTPPQGDAEERRGRADIQRLLRRYTLPEIIAILCRDLGLPTDPAEWNDAAILAVPYPGPAPVPTQPAATHPAAPPPIRPDPASHPPPK
jgi:hypothetical protein